MKGNTMVVEGVRCSTAGATAPGTAGSGTSTA